MPDINLLEFTVQNCTATQLDIKVKNTSGVSLEKALTIEVSPPLSLLDSRLINASKAAAVSIDPPGVASLAGVVAAPTGWAVMAKADMSDNTAVIMLRNDRDQAFNKVTPPTKLEANAEFTIGIPLNPNVQRESVEFPYVYQHGAASKDGTRMTGTLKLTADTVEWVPDVTLMTDQQNPSMIKPRTEVKITWHITQAVSAILRGPLPNGDVQWTLSDSPKSNYKMSDGSIKILAVGPVTYLLQAEVKGPPGKPNVQVVKMISLDVHAGEKYGFLEARPSRVLPFGLVEIGWAAWGVNDIIIDAGGASRKIPLTDLSLSGDRQGIGIMRLTAGPPGPAEVVETTVNLNAEIGNIYKTEASTKFSVIAWRKMENSNFTGQPVGLAVAAGQMALLTTDGLWIAEVGRDDFTTVNYNRITQVKFTRAAASTDNLWAWLAIAAFGDKFVVLRQTNQNVLQVALYSSQGALEGVPIDLPHDLRPLMDRGGSVFGFAVYGGRAYAVIETARRAGSIRRAFSVSFDGRPTVREEPILETSQGYRLLVFDDALYGLNRDSGQMIRFTLKTDGRLELDIATAAVSQTPGNPPSSMIKDGMLVPVGHVLAVLSPSSLPSLASLSNAGLKNVLRYKDLTPPRSANTIPQDLVYNPQDDRWARCGRGIELKPGMVCGFRGGDSPRLWMIEPKGDTYTLTVGSEHLFSHNYLTKKGPADLSPYFNQMRTVRILNDTDMQFVPLNETCYKAGLTAFSATSPVEMTPPVVNLEPGAQAEFQLRYNEGDSPTTTLRFLLQRPAGIKNEYFLEVTYSGPNLSSATAVFKRIAVDATGRFSIAEVPGTRQQYSADHTIVVFPKPLIDGIALTLRNSSPYHVWLRRPEAKNEAERETLYNGEKIIINYSTTPFSIYAHGAGELFFDVDFAMPHGIHETFENATQTTCIRVDSRKTQGLSVDSASFNPTDRSTVYECTLRYKLTRALERVYLGDGVPNKEGTAFYLPVAFATDATKGELMKIDANNLFVTATSTFLDGIGIFVAPNSVAVSSNRVMAIVNSFLFVYDHSLKQLDRVPMWWHKVVTNLKADPGDNKMFTLGMEESSGPAKYSYSFWSRSFTQPVVDVVIGLDQPKGFRPARVSGGPAWVAPTTPSPMDVSRSQTVAICVEGGVFLVDVQSKKVTEVELNGTGREEAILIDPTGALVFCAHARPDNNALMISRINRSNPNEKLTIALPSTITNMATDTNPPATQNLQYKPQHAVSLAVAAEALFVSHGTKIYLLDKQTLAQRQNVTLDKPCRLIQVREGRPPGQDPRYGPPKDCYLVWAVGSIYVGDGKSVKDFKTSVYKIGILH